MPDLLVVGDLRTLDPARPRAQAALVRAGRFLKVGTPRECEAAASPGFERLDLPHGAVGLPGLVDAHGHAALHGRSLVEVDLTGAASEAECVERVRARAAQEPRGAWILGQGWDQTAWPGGAFPTLDALSAAVPDHPVWLTRVDVHAVWVNARALSLCGIDRATPDPQGGLLVRRDGGAPAGVLVDAAMELVRGHLPLPKDEALEVLVLRSLHALRALGLTGLHDASCGPELLAVYRSLAARGALPLRVFAMVDGQCSDAELEARLAPFAQAPEQGLLTVRAVKLFADGALGSRGAKLFEPYEDDSGNTGLWVTEPRELRRRILRLMSRGVQPCVHAIGDRASFEVLDAFVEGARPALRPRVEHLQLLRPQDAPLLSRAGAVASMQPTHCTSDGRWVEARLGAGTPRQVGAYAWRQALAQRAVLAFGSDLPIEPPDPRVGLWAAVARSPRGMEGPWMPEQRLSVEEALRAFTAGPAFAEHAEARRGVLREGMDADLTVFGEDPLACAPRDLPHLTVVGTLVAGGS